MRANYMKYMSMKARAKRLGDLNYGAKPKNSHYNSGIVFVKLQFKQSSSLVSVGKCCCFHNKIVNCFWNYFSKAARRVCASLRLAYLAVFPQWDVSDPLAPVS